MTEWKIPPFKVEAVFMQMSQLVDWGIALTGLPELWKRTRGNGITCAVLDTGCHLTHPDLADAIVEAKDFTGSKFGPADKNGHGTHCAGIVAARDNEVGCVGVAPDARLLIGKVLGDAGSGSGASVAAGIRWAVERKADVISMSLGSGTPDPNIYAAISEARNAGAFIAAAAGNSGPGPNTVDFPGKWRECIAVGAMNKDRKISRFSSRGPEVAIVAPGEQITSTWHQAPLATLSGTSMATPFVAGVMCLILAKHRLVPGSTPVLTPDNMRQHLQRTALDLDAPGFDPNAGWGLVNPGKLLGEEEVPGSLHLGPADLSEAGMAKVKRALGDIREISLKLG